MSHNTHDEKRVYYKKQFERLCAYCRERLGWEVEVRAMRDSSGELEEQTRVIRIATRLRWELRLYTLLHEMGHVVLWHEPDFPIRFPYSESFVERGSKESRRKRNSVGILEEESAAWDRGLCLAIRLGIEIDREVFDRDKLRSLLTYIRQID